MVECPVHEEFVGLFPCTVRKSSKKITVAALDWFKYVVTSNITFINSLIY